MNCPSKTYSLVNPAEVAARVAAAGGPRIDPTQTTGSAEAHGVALAWTIADGTIAVHTTAKPFYVSCAEIEEHLDALFA